MGITFGDRYMFQFLWKSRAAETVTFFFPSKLAAKARRRRLRALLAAREKGEANIFSD